MPSISQRDLDALKEGADNWHRVADSYRSEKSLLEGRVIRFDDILDKIYRAAYGAPLQSDNRGNAVLDGFWTGSSIAESQHRCQAPSEAERHAGEVRELHQRIVELESRIAAVAALAVFAKDHKA